MPVPTTIEGDVHRPSGRTLVLCFDGTGNQYCDKTTNVVKLFSMLEKNKPDEQIVYYQTGIGTYTPPGVLSSVARAWSKMMDSAFAWYLPDHVCGGYRFLMNNYRPGDRICLFGFSRGAYTARALAGMLRKTGLLPPDNDEHIPFAYKMFKAIDDKSWKLADKFRSTFSREVEIEFLGVWDSVSSVGGLIPRTLPNTAFNPNVKTFRHALALDERRIMFRPNYWRNSKLKPVRHSKTDVKEVWFAGVHSDVGGGVVEDSAAYSLAYIPLRWMVRECIASSARMLFKPEALASWGIKPTTKAFDEQRQDIGYQGREREDALSKSHSVFDKLNLWFLLELFPIKRHLIKSDGSDYYTTIRSNFDWRRWRIRGRDIWPQEGPINVHSSVKLRMDNDQKYQPEAKWPGEPRFVE